jgi:hypothetical protein
VIGTEAEVEVEVEDGVGGIVAWVGCAWRDVVSKFGMLWLEARERDASVSGCLGEEEKRRDR